MQLTHCPQCHTDHLAPKTAQQIASELLHRLEPNHEEQLAAAHLVIHGLAKDVEATGWLVSLRDNPTMMEMGPPKRGARSVVIYFARGSTTDIVVQRTSGNEKQAVVSFDYDPFTKTLRGKGDAHDASKPADILMQAVSDLLTEDLQ